MKKKLRKFRGTVSDREVNYIKKLLPNNNLTSSISNQQLNWLKKRTGAAVTLSELKRLKKLIPNK